MVDTVNHIELLSVDVNGQSKHGTIYALGAGKGYIKLLLNLMNKSNTMFSSIRLSLFLLWRRTCTVLCREEE